MTAPTAKSNGQYPTVASELEHGPATPTATPAPAAWTDRRHCIHWPFPDDLSDDLKSFAQFVHWTWTTSPDGRPQIAIGHHVADPARRGPSSVADSSTWMDFPEACAHLKKFQFGLYSGFFGLGFVVSAADPFFVVRLRKAFDKAKRELTEYAYDIAYGLFDTWHFRIAGTRDLAIVGKGKKPTALCGQDAKDRIQVYDDGFFAPVQFNPLSQGPEDMYIADRQAALDFICAEDIAEQQKARKAISTPLLPPPQVFGITKAVFEQVALDIQREQARREHTCKAAAAKAEAKAARQAKAATEKAAKDEADADAQFTELIRERATIDSARDANPAKAAEIAEAAAVAKAAEAAARTAAKVATLLGTDAARNAAATAKAAAKAAAKKEYESRSHSADAEVRRYAHAERADRAKHPCSYPYQKYASFRATGDLWDITFRCERRCGCLGCRSYLNRKELANTKLRFIRAEVDGLPLTRLECQPREVERVTVAIWRAGGDYRAVHGPDRSVLWTTATLSKKLSARYHARPVSAADGISEFELLLSRWGNKAKAASASAAWQFPTLPGEEVEAKFEILGDAKRMDEFDKGFLEGQFPDEKDIKAAKRKGQSGTLPNSRYRELFLRLLQEKISGVEVDPRTVPNWHRGHILEWWRIQCSTVAAREAVKEALRSGPFDSFAEIDPHCGKRQSCGAGSAQDIPD